MCQSSQDKNWRGLCEIFHTICGILPILHAHLFPSLQNYFDNKNLPPLEDCESKLECFFLSEG